MSNLRLMVREFYSDGSPPNAFGHFVKDLETLKSSLLLCLGPDGSGRLESAEIWLIEADDENGDTLDEVCLEFLEMPR